MEIKAGRQYIVFGGLLTLVLAGVGPTSIYAQSRTPSPQGWGGPSTVSGAENVQSGFSNNSLTPYARLGFADLTGVDGGAFTFGIGTDYALAQSFLVGGTIDYWNKSSGELVGRTVELSDWAFGANAKIVFETMDPAIQPFALAGLSFHRFSLKEKSVKSESEVPTLDRANEKYKDIATEVGVDLGGGVMYQVQDSVNAMGEVRYKWLFDRSLELDQLAFLGGLAYTL